MKDLFLEGVLTQTGSQHTLVGHKQSENKHDNRLDRLVTR